MKKALPPTPPDKNLATFVRADLSAYENQYVALCEGEVVAHGEDPGTVCEDAERRFPGKKVVLWKVMPQGVYVFGAVLP